MNDPIERADAINEIVRWKGYIDEDMISRIQIGLKKLPSAQPEQRWIPCSERLPEESGRYIITAYDGVSRRTATAVFQKRLGGWCLSGRMAYWRVVAWMSPPEPYRNEGENDETD